MTQSYEDQKATFIARLTTGRANRARFTNNALDKAGLLRRTLTRSTLPAVPHKGLPASFFTPAPRDTSWMQDWNAPC